MAEDVPAERLAALQFGKRSVLGKSANSLYKKYARKPEPRPRMVDAYLFWLFVEKGG